MYPILFVESATSFNTNGIGRLSDALSCKVTEQRNGIYELEMSYQMYGQHYSDIGLRKIIVAKPSANGTIQPFRIYKITKPINGKVTVYAQHISYDLSKNTCMPQTVAASNAACNAALQGLKNTAVEACPFTFTTDVTTVASYNQTTPASIKQRMGGVEGSILDQFGGEYEYDNFTVRLLKNRGTTRNITLRYGKNITDLNQEENINDTVTGIVPFWIDSEGNRLRLLTERVILSPNHAGYSNHMVVPLDMSGEWEEQPTEEQLRAAATVYVNRQGFGVPKVSTKVSFVNLADTEEYRDILPLQNVNLCDTVTVQFEKLGISTTAKITETVYDVLKEKYDSIQVGELRSNFSTTITGIESDMTQSIDTAKKRILADIDTDTQDIVNNATAWITSADGHVIAIKNSDGEWTDLLFTEYNDPPRNVLRINANGIGFSSNGVDGPFYSAWTIDGSFNADYINTGILRGASGENYWNMQTGEFCLASTSKLKLMNTTFTGVNLPTNSNYPASSWSTDDEKASHVGQTYKNTSTGKTYIYRKRGSGLLLTFDSQCATESGYDYVKIYYLKNGTWYESSKFDGGYNGSTNNIAGKQVYIPANEFYFQWYTDGSVVAWGYRIASIVSVSENKTGINYFTQKSSDPRPSISWATINIGSSALPESSHNYGSGENSGYLMTSASDPYYWEEYDPTISSYVSDMANSGASEELTQEEIFNILTNNGQTQGLYLQNGKIYLNGQYLQTGQIAIGGSSYNTSPTLLIRDSYNNTIGSWTKDGIVANRGQFGIFTIDGSNNAIYVPASTYYIQSEVQFELPEKAYTKYFYFNPLLDGFESDFYVNWKFDFIDWEIDPDTGTPIEPAHPDTYQGFKFYVELQRRYGFAGSWKKVQEYTTYKNTYTETGSATGQFGPIDHTFGENGNLYRIKFVLKSGHGQWYLGAQIWVNNVTKPKITKQGIYGNFIGSFSGSAILRGLSFGIFDYDEESSCLSAEYGDDDNLKLGRLSATMNIKRKNSGTTQSVTWSTSDKRAKRNIKDLETDLSIKLIDGTIPKSFRYKHIEGYHYGMIAQDARELLDSLGEETSQLEHSMEIPDEETGMEDQRTIDYHEYIPHLINYVKYLKAEIEKLKGRNE